MKKTTFLLVFTIVTISYGQSLKASILPENIEQKRQIEPLSFGDYQAKQFNDLNLKVEQGGVELRIDSIIGVGYGVNTYVSNFYEYDNNYASITSYLMVRPDLNDILYAENNTITVDMLYHNGGTSFKLELSRDNFNTIDFETVIDTPYYKIIQDKNGEELLWNTVYQVRVTPVDASEPDLLGSVETIFPTILKAPSTWDVIDVAAKVNWVPLGQTVTSIKAFASDDLRLTTPLVEASVTEGEFQAGTAFIQGLEPDTSYQIAIYSGTELRGWENYNTLVAEPDYASIPNLIDLRDDTNSGAVSSALTSAADGATILVARGNEYEMEGMVALDKSVTIRAAYGFGEKRARLLFPYNFDLSEGAEIDHLRFVDLELRGSDWTGKYLINISKPGTLNELTIDNCYVTNFRGIGRIKTYSVTLNDYVINNSVVDSINGYGLFTVDHTESTLKNIKLTNNTFNHFRYFFLVSRNNSESVLIDNCTLANINETGRPLFRWRGGEGKNDITNGITISNTVIGHSWDVNGLDNISTTGREGLDNTTFTISNTFTVADFAWSSTGSPIEALPVGNAGSTQAELWVDPEHNNFNFLDIGFIGKNLSGDPRWYSYYTQPIEINYNWEATSQAYVKVGPSHKHEYFFDENNNGTLYAYSNWDNATASFILNSKSEYSYDANGNRTLNLDYRWNSNTASIVPHRKYEYSYDTNDNQILRVYYKWDTASSSFIPNEKHEYSYDANDNQTLRAYYNWDTTSSSFIPVEKHENSFDANGNQTLSLSYDWDIATASFLLKYKSEYSYYLNSNQTLILNYSWDTVSASFLPFSKHERVYDENGNETLRSYSFWDSPTESFIESRKTERNYVTNPYGGYTSLRIESEWDIQAGILKPISKFETIVILDNETNYTLLRNDFKYDTNSSEWTKAGLWYFHYSKISTLAIPKPDEKMVSIYPNPTSDFLNIKGAKAFSNANFVLYDVNGRKVLSKQLKASTQIDVQYLTPALYFYRITDGKTLNESGAVVKE